MIELFRKVAFVEGITTIVLFFVAMPLKYFAGEPGLVPPVGWAHGIAFIAYVATMILAFKDRPIGAAGWMRAFAASLVPLGTFANDAWVRRQSAS